MSVVSNQLNYAENNHSHPVYSHSKILPVQGSASFVISSGGNELIFETSPNQAFNFSKSILNFRVAYGGSGVGNFNWAFADCLSAIQSITVQTKGGLTLMSCPNFDVYSKSVLKHITKINDFLENDTSGNNSGCFTGLQRNDELKTNIISTRPPVTADGVATGAVLDGILNYTDFRYLIVGADNSGPTINYRIPFSLFKEHIIGLDKDLLFPEVLQVKIVFNAREKLGFLSTNVAQPWTGTGAITMVTAGGYTVSDAVLYLAMEKDQQINNSLREKVYSAEGLKCLFEYVYPVKTAFSAAGTHSTTMRFNRNNGSHLLRIHYLATPLTETIMNTYNIANGNGAKLNNYYLSLNNIRIQDYNISTLTTNLEDYLAHYDKLRGSCIQNSTMFQYNFVHCQAWDDNVSALEEVVGEEQNKVMGLPLDTEQRIDFFGTGGIALNHYSFSVCLKKLIINSTGIQVM